MPYPLLLVGTAFDGPADVPVLPGSIEGAFEQFGASCYERFILDDGDKAVTLSSAPASTIDFYWWVDRLFTEFTQISGVSISGSVVSFEGLGYDLFQDAGSETIELTLRYLRAMGDNDPSVYKAYAEAVSVGGGDVYVMRVGGTEASAIIGTGSNQVILTSPYRGSLYNSTLLSCDGDTLSVTPPPGKGETLYYSLTGLTALDLANAINLDFAKGYGYVKAAATGSGLVSVTPGYITLSGGTDGDLTDEVIEASLDRIDTDGIKVIHICGRRFPSNSGAPNPLAGILSSDYLADQRYPTMFVQGVDYDSSVLPATYAAAVASSGTIIDTSVTKVVGECYYNYAPAAPYYSSLAPGYAAVLAKSSAGCIYEPVNTREIRPYLDESTSKSLASAGYVTFAQSVSKGIVVYSDVTSDPRWDATCHLTYTAIADAVYTVVDPLLGTTNVKADSLESSITSALDAIATLATKSVSVTIAADNSINIDIAARPYGRVNTIKFGVMINAAFTPAGSP